MNKFEDLLDIVELLESDTRDKAKDFKKRLKPYFKKMQAAQIGDPRRYTFMMVWPFLRDVIKVPDMQGQDTPLNYNNILRKLEDVYDRGELPEDAGDKWEEYANEQFDEFVNSISATRQPRARKSHVKGRDVQNVIQVAGETGTGFTEGETASERAKRIEAERELKKDVQQRGPEEVRAEFKQALGDIADKLRGFSKPGEDRGKGVPEFGETYTQQYTYLVEILFDEPVVQKQPVISLFPEDELASPVERSQRGLDVELLPTSAIAKQIKYHGVDKVEAYLKDIISNKVGGVGVRVNIMEPETEEPAGKLIDVYKGRDVNVEEDECGFCSKSSHKHSKNNPVADEDSEGEGYDAETTLSLQNGTVTIYFKQGKVVEVVSEDPDITFNLNTINSDIANGVDFEQAVAGSMHYKGRAPVMDSVLAYMPPVTQSDLDYKPVILETTRERFKPKNNHQILEYMKHFAK